MKSPRLIAFIGGLLVIAGCGKPAEKPGSSTLPGPNVSIAKAPTEGSKDTVVDKKDGATKPPAISKPDLTLTSAELVQRYVADKAGMIKANEGKTAEVTGAVHHFDVTGDDRALVFLEKGDKVCLRIVSADAAPWKKYLIGQKVKATGRLQFIESPIKGVADDIDITFATIVIDKDKPTTTMLTSEKLSEACKDRESLDKLRGKYIYVTGEVVAKGGTVPQYVDLKGTETKPVRCNFFGDKAAVESLKIGTKVKILGAVTGSGIEYDPVDGCHLIEP